MSYTGCWKCGTTIACADGNGLPVQGLDVDVVLCDACAIELADRLDEAAPTPSDLREWKDPTPVEEAPEPRPPRVSITIKSTTTGEVLAHYPGTVAKEP